MTHNRTFPYPPAVRRQILSIRRDGHRKPARVPNTVEGHAFARMIGPVPNHGTRTVVDVNRGERITLIRVLMVVIVDE